MRTGQIVFELARVAVKTRACHWIATPEGDYGYEWCPDCGYFKVRNLRRRDRRRRADYILDGGWHTSHDHMPICIGCGAYLDGALTLYGARIGAGNYRENGLSTKPEIDALYLSEIIDGLAEEDEDDLALAVSLADEVLSRATSSEEGR